MTRGYKSAVALSKVRRSKEGAIKESDSIQMSLLKEDLVRTLQNSVQNFAIGMGLVVGLEMLEAQGGGALRS